jgi:hypothetical protein
VVDWLEGDCMNLSALYSHWAERLLRSELRPLRSATYD